MLNLLYIVQLSNKIIQAAVARGTVVPWLGNEYAQMQVVRFDSGNKYFRVQRNYTCNILVLYRQ